jgi:hypothetical protein
MSDQHDTEQSARLWVNRTHWQESAEERCHADSRLPRSHDAQGQEEVAPDRRVDVWDIPEAVAAFLLAIYPTALTNARKAETTTQQTVAFQRSDILYENRGRTTAGDQR